MSDLRSARDILALLPRMAEEQRADLADTLRDGPRREPLIRALLIQLKDVGTPREAGMYVRFLDHLYPTVPECARWPEQLVRLAGSKIPAVVNFAIRALAECLPTAGLHPHDWVPALIPAVASTNIATVRTAVRLLASELFLAINPLAGGPVPGLIDHVLPGLRTAMSHPDAELQRMIARIFMRYSRDQSIRDMLLEACTAAPVPTLAADGDHMEPPGPTLDEVVTWARQSLVSDVLPRWKADAITAAITATGSGAEPPAVEPRPWETAAASGDDRRIEPIRRWDTLVEETIACLGRWPDSPMELERVLDGIAALGSRRPADFDKQVRPLADRLERVVAPAEGAPLPAWGEGLHSDLLHLVAAWLLPDHPLPPPGPADTPKGWLLARMRELALMLRAGDAAGLLALPSYEGWWLEPSALADRVREAGDAALARPVDVAVALARLRPDGLAEAAARLDGVPGVLAAVVRAACGSGEDVSAAPEFVRKAVIWRLGLPHDGPPYLFGAPTPELPDTNLPPSEFYAPARMALDWWNNPSRDMDHYGYHHFDTLWPIDTTWLWTLPFYRHFAVRRLTDPDEPLPPVALNALLNAAVKPTIHPEKLADTLAILIGDGRLTSAELGAAPGLSTALAHGTSRILEVFSLVAVRSPLHWAVIRRSLLSGVAAWQNLPGGKRCAVLAFLNVLCCGDGCGLSDSPARSALTVLARGRHRSAILSRRLLERPTNLPDWPTAAARTALHIRVARTIAGDNDIVC